MLLTLDQVKDQLKIDRAEADEDEQLTLYATAVESVVKANINRPIYATIDDIPAGTSWAISVDENPDLLLAMLLLVTHFYLNRSATTADNSRQLPLGVKMLLSPYVIIAPELDQEFETELEPEPEPDPEVAP